MSDRESADDPSVNQYESEEEEQTQEKIDESNFHPNRIFYIASHYLISKSIAIHDVTDQVKMSYQGGDIEDEIRDAAKKVSKEDEHEKNPKYTISKEHRFFGRSFVMKIGNDGEELAYWKHPHWAVGTAHLSFPSGSAHGSHEIDMSAPRKSSRTNQWVQDSVTYEWNCDSKWKTSRQSLYKIIGSKRTLIGKYAQTKLRMGAGGILLLDTNELDEVMGTLTICVMLRRMLQREAARSNAGAAGTGGWVGAA